MNLPIFTKLRKGNVFASVCQELCPGGGGNLTQCMLGCTAHGQIPPRADTPPWADTPLSRHPPGQPPWQTALPQQTATAAEGTYPTGMQSCFDYIIF